MPGAALKILLGLAAIAAFSYGCCNCYDSHLAVGKSRSRANAAGTLTHNDVGALYPIHLLALLTIKRIWSPIVWSMVRGMSWYKRGIPTGSALQGYTNKTTNKLSQNKLRNPVVKRLKGSFLSSLTKRLKVLLFAVVSNRRLSYNGITFFFLPPFNRET